MFRQIEISHWILKDCYKTHQESNNERRLLVYHSESDNTTSSGKALPLGSKTWISGEPGDGNLTGLEDLTNNPPTPPPPNLIGCSLEPDPVTRLLLPLGTNSYVCTTVLLGCDMIFVLGSHSARNRFGSTSSSSSRYSRVSCILCLSVSDFSLPRYRLRSCLRLECLWR